MAMTYTSYLEGRIEQYEQMVGKLATAMHVLQHANDTNIETCKQGMCPKVHELLHPSQTAKAPR
jgi:hypothetical protein